ncbi:translation regulator [Stemphylium lycopersici]|uniref:Translation regulator n=1 Tax=Stemphylium lycopersici TaxID=183478 RepID=A0A364N216_STELY|nr:translation regulator [Stemphylium lycopersici]
MLERASTCLESGGRQLLRAPTPCLRNRRTLHSAFWHHGAGHLNALLPLAASSIFDPPSGDADDAAAQNSPSSATKASKSLPLDFLYPEKTLEFLKRLSVNRYETPGAERRSLYAANVRRYSTLRPQALHEASIIDEDAVEEARQEAARLVARSDAVTELTRILYSSEPGQQELAWQLYLAIPKGQAKAYNDMRCRLLEFLSRDDQVAVPTRVLQVFSELPPSARLTSSYRAAIIANIALRMVGPAINLLESSLADSRLDSLHSGIDVILRRTVFDEQWDLTFRVFRSFRHQTTHISAKDMAWAIRDGNTRPEIWQGVAHLPELLEHFQSFLRYVREFQHELTSSTESEQDLACFVMSFVPHVMDRVMKTKKPDENFIWNYFVQLFEDLDALNLPTAACYEYAIKQMLELPRYQRYSNKRKIWLALYKRYRRRCLTDPAAKSDSRPSLSVLRNLIFHYTAFGAWERVEGFINDIRTFYPGQPLRPGLLKHLIQAHANAGDITRVHEYLHELQSNYESAVDIKVLSSLPYVYARRKDLDGAIREFNRIHTEYKMVPDAVCWNILLLAHVRAGDLDGALVCFNNCMDYGIVPDVQTFGPLLDFCAHRGDVEAFETLFSRARQMGVQLDTDVRARSGYVQAFLTAGDPEGAEAIAATMLNNWNAGKLYGDTLTHTWNLLIQQYALNRDLAGSKQRYREMAENNIPLDEWTYGSLMRALIEVKQTNAAYKLLRVTMPQHGFRAHALHYAIVITGFLNERQVPLAINAYERMMKRRIPQTESSRMASIQALGAFDLQRLNRWRAKSRNYRLRTVEKALDEILTSSMTDMAHRQPAHQRIFDPLGPVGLPQSYLGLMISLYNERSAYRLAKELFDEAVSSAKDVENHTPPLNLTTAMMEAHYKAGKHAEVEKFWELARTSASKLTKTFQQAMQPPAAAPEITSLLDPSIQERYQESAIASNRRQILVQPTRTYIRSLMAQPGDDVVRQAQYTLIDLLTNGFVVDSLVWNEYIQQIASRGLIVDAFATCEFYLMPQFPGWRSLHPNYLRKDRQGYQLMEIRHYDIKKTSVLPRYKTLVTLAKAYGQARQDERDGIGYDDELQAWMPEILERAAPLTVRAIETMPRTQDRLQQRFFGNVF